MKHLFKIFIVGIFVFFVFSVLASNLYGQEIAKNNNCEDNLGRFQNAIFARNEGTKIIVIARRGSKEKSNSYSESRLNVFSRLLYEKDRVFAIGKKAINRPQVEIYVNGKLELIFEVKNREKLKVGNCGN
ncbi:MAG TPA: hypothetical protein PKY82_31380 [Pyrinomonadaceae bacterium]|nr:hypothetical protein [Pyrinomonadaceae bacterium]